MTSSSRARSPTKTPRSNLSLCPSRVSAAGTAAISGRRSPGRTADGGRRRPAGWPTSSDLDPPPVAGTRAGIGSDGSPGNGGDPDDLSSGGWELELGRICWVALGPVVCDRI